MIRVGTCSWTEKTLIKSEDFYPKKARSAEDRLRYYATAFGTVEVDSVFYAIPGVSTVLLWDERTPRDFIFHVKVYGALTGHTVDARSLPKDVRDEIPAKDRGKPRVSVKEPELLTVLAMRLVETLKPLKESGKLGLIVFQYPPWFTYSIRSLDYILFCKQIMGPLALAVEFRHGSWLTPERAETAFRFLREHTITYVVADEPQTSTLATVPFLPRVTTDIAYFRFHGRNRANWFRRGRETADRYNYLYSAEELEELKGPVLDAEKEAKKTFALFNNCYGSNAVRNAASLAELIGLIRGEEGRTAA